MKLIRAKVTIKTKPTLVKGWEKIAMKKKNNTNTDVLVLKSNILLFFKNQLNQANISFTFSKNDLSDFSGCGIKLVSPCIFSKN